MEKGCFKNVDGVNYLQDKTSSFKNIYSTLVSVENNRVERREQSARMHEKKTKEPAG